MNETTNRLIEYCSNGCVASNELGILIFILLVTIVFFGIAATHHLSKQKRLARFMVDELKVGKKYQEWEKDNRGLI